MSYVFRRYTTPVPPLIVSGMDLTTYDVYVTISQGSHSLTIEDAEMELDADGNTIITFDMSQITTAEFREGPAKVQVNFIDDQGRRNATNEAAVTIGGNLLDRVLS